MSGKANSHKLDPPEMPLAIKPFQMAAPTVLGALVELSETKGGTCGIFLPIGFALCPLVVERIRYFASLVR